MADNNSELIYGDKYTADYAERMRKRALEKEAIFKDIPTAKYGEHPHTAIWRDKAERLEREKVMLTRALDNLATWIEGCIPSGHEGDSESGEHFEDCERCSYECAVAEARAILNGEMPCGLSAKAPVTPANEESK